MGHGSLRLTARGQAVLDGAQVSVPAAAPPVAAPPKPNSPTTRRSSAGCARCAASWPKRPTCRPTSSSPTVRWLRWRPTSRNRRRASWPSTAWASASWRSTASRSWPRSGPTAPSTASGTAQTGARPPQRDGRLHGSRTEEVGAAVRRRPFGSRDPGVVRRDAGHCHPASWPLCLGRAALRAGARPGTLAVVGGRSGTRVGGVATHGPEGLRPIFEALGETIPYDELHIMRMVALCLGPYRCGRPVHGSMSCS